MGLRTYRAKRDFDRTAEPRGAGAPSRRRGDAFVVQKHAASHLHFDFRLELDGVLLSWAVPKGVPTAAGARALAVRTEDHPLEYETFEGVIPRGQYGGGTVMLWDRGTWRPDGDAAAMLAAGKLDFVLAGERLRGRWSLVRMGGSDAAKRTNWLLIKRTDRGVPESPRPDLDRSVTTGRSMAEIAHAADRRWSSHVGEVTTDRSAAAAPGARRAKSTKSAKRANGAKPTSQSKATKGRSTTRAKAATRDARGARSGTALAAAAAALPGAVAAAQPRSWAPQLATLVQATPTDDGWLHEVKFDGYRLVACLADGEVRLLTRTGQDWTALFPTVRDVIAALPVQRAILDGEVVVLTADGTSSFQLLQNLLDRGDSRQLVYYAFDLPHCAGHDLTRTPLLARKELLERLLAPLGAASAVRYSEHVVGHGPAFFQKACALGLEGVVSKRADARYENRRTRAWVKSKCLQRQELVVGGWTAPAGSRRHFGALLLGVHENGELRYAGKVGTGFTDASLAATSRTLARLATDRCPFVNPPRGAEARSVHWVKPRCVVEIAFTGWTDDGKLRHPSFQGVREDKDPRSIRRERAEPRPDARPDAPRAAPHAARSGSGTTTVAGVRISHPDRVLYPDVGLTKADVARYYEQVAERVLPHVAGRPLTLVRCPQGTAGSCFYQKHVARTLPPPVRRYLVAPDPEPWLGIDDLAGLVTLVQFGALELHPWLSRAEQPERPDRIVIDLDPGPDVPWARVVGAATRLRELFTALGLASFPRTTGGKGLHVVVPIQPRPTWDEVKTFAHDVVAALAATDPELYVLTATKAKRHGRIFLDYLRNARGATAVASYSTRARAGAPVAMPLAWTDVHEELDPQAFTVLTVPGLVAAGADPWRDFFRTKQSLTAAMRGAVRRP